MEEREEIEAILQNHIFKEGIKLGMFKAISYILDGKDVVTFTKSDAQEYLDKHATGFDLYEEVK